MSLAEPSEGARLQQSGALKSTAYNRDFKETIVGHMHGGPPQQGPMPLPGVQNVIAVGSGKGGVGKTTIAVNLAVALGKLGHKVGLLDADIYGPNVPLMMGVNRQPDVLGENRIAPLTNHGIKVISVGFISPGDRPLVWRGPMLHSIIKPPGTGDVVISLFQTVPLTGAVVVSTPSDVSLQDARKAIEMFRGVKVDVFGVIENMSTFHCPHCQHEIDIFSKGGVERTAKQFGVSYLGAVELDADVRKGGDSGLPTVLGGEQSPHAKPFFDFARKIAQSAIETKTENVIEIH